ncbi:PREDICTED: uncharacterized protein LOC109230451 [Nicotiana attenuata]|uniref:Uncharacterized protein n=1 Tax=Nicotiana attenuata TaxID=49451 RepID=A0A1J6I7C9_NICAT|nr:PREDICTED: uncharacterized protein LOC109230451 [Nicotiana attenuata]OIT00418.1 hypothetical protein A4A49_60092 [Nicotiana attenuata]
MRKPILDRLIDAGIGTISRCITSSLRRKDGILHHPEFNQAIAEYGRTFTRKRVNEDDAMLIGVDVLVRYTFIRSGGVGFIYFMKSYFDWLKECKLEIERSRVRSFQEAEQELEQIMQQYQISKPSIKGGNEPKAADGAQAKATKNEKL